MKVGFWVMDIICGKYFEKIDIFGPKFYWTRKYRLTKPLSSKVWWLKFAGFTAKMINYKS